MPSPSPSPAAIRDAWRAYNAEVWVDHFGDAEKAKDACMREAIKAAAETDGVVWPEATRG
jgi:hypothetical protein